jgi:hypothetical protein
MLEALQRMDLELQQARLDTAPPSSSSSVRPRPRHRPPRPRPARRSSSVGVRIDQAVHQFVDAHSSRATLSASIEDLGDRGRAGRDGLIMCLRPSSMRLAISISPSRVSSSTEPISRMYMRTGSVVRPNSESRVDSACSASSSRRRRRTRQQRPACSRTSAGLGVGRLVVDLDAHVVEGADDAFDLLGVQHVVRAGGR